MSTIAGTALILGASRGIGLELTRQYLSENWRVLATHRDQQGREALAALGAKTLQLDLHDSNDLAGLGWQLDGELIDVAVINAGVYGPRDSSTLNPPAPADFDAVMHTNVLGAMRLVPVIAPLLTETAGTLAFISSKMGSIAAAGVDGGALYRVSKAALNMVVKITHSQYHPQQVRVLALHPGWVRTDMGGSQASVNAQESVYGLREVIAQPEIYPSGGFFDYQGQAIAW